jgi:hypothetical protein
MRIGNRHGGRKQESLGACRSRLGGKCPHSPYVRYGHRTLPSPTESSFRMSGLVILSSRTLSAHTDSLGRPHYPTCIHLFLTTVVVPPRLTDAHLMAFPSSHTKQKRRMQDSALEAVRVNKRNQGNLGGHRR